MKKSTAWPLFILSIGVFMAALDNGIISAALTTLIDAFEVSATWGSWSVTIYTLGMAISIPVVGKMADRYGIKRLLLIEIILFGIGSLLVAASFNFEMFLMSRFLQAMGGGGMFVLASAYIIKTFPVEKQGKALGMVGAMNGIASVIGPNAGSLILSFTESWHWLFLINVPIALLLLLAAYRKIHSVALSESAHLKIDWNGIILLSLAILSVMYSLTFLEGVDILKSLTEPKFLLFFGIGLLLLLLLVGQERRVEKSGTVDPILPVDLLRNRRYRWLLGLAFFSGAILASVIFIPAYIEQYLGVSRHLSGYWLTPLALAAGIGSGAGGAFVDRRGPIFTLVVAALLTALGFALFPLWVTSLWQMVVASCVVGIGFGMMMGAPINVLATEDATSEQATALSTSSLFRQVGLTLAPTLYAGFIARSMMNLGETISQNMEEAGIAGGGASFHHPEQAAGELGSMDMEGIREAFANIPDPTISEVLLTSLEEAVKNGYDGLFGAALAVSILMLLATIILGLIRSQKQPAIKEKGGDDHGAQAAD